MSARCTVFGTNGKGSTAAAMEAMLSVGLKTALYTSPHLVSLQERLRIRGRYISFLDWREAWRRIKDTVTRDAELDADKPSFFENFTALGFVLTKEAEADIAVVEAGMGGRYDATSVCRQVATMINPIGMDHTQYLGSTLELIAGEKFAAVKDGVDAFYAGDDESLVPDFLDHCGKSGAVPHLLDRIATPINVKSGPRGASFDYEALNGEIGGVRRIEGLSTPLIGAHQARNAARAVTVLLSLRGKYPDFSFLTPEAIKRGLKAVDWPGRMELLPYDGRLVMLDGAHNAHAMQTLVSSLDSMEDEGRKIKVGAVVLAVMSDKEIPPILRILKKLDCPVYCAELSMERAAQASELARMSRGEGLDVAGVYSDPASALRVASSGIGAGEITLCCGSLYLVGFFRKVLKYGKYFDEIIEFNATNDKDSVRI